MPEVHHRGFVAVSLAAMLLAAVAVPAQGAETGTDFRGIEITPFIAWGSEVSINSSGSGSEDFDTDSSSAFGLTLGIPWSDIGDLEIWYSRQSTTIQPDSGAAGSDVDLQYLHVGGTYLFEQRSGFVPFMLATLGATQIDPDVAGSSSDTFFSFGVGGGLKYNPAARLGLRLDGRLIGTFVDSDSRILCGFEPDTGSGCLVGVSGQIVWQFEAQAGVVFRF